MLETLDRKLISSFSNHFFGDSLTSKIINTPKIFVLCIGVLLMFVPAVSISQGHAVNSGKEVNTATAGTNYSILPAGGNSPRDNGSDMFPQSTQNISKWQTIVHVVSVGSGVKFLEVNVNWGVKKNSLALTIYTPSGANLGTCYDNSDGKVNGKIHICIYPCEGYVDKGTWTFNVYGATVSESQRYAFTAYKHY